MVLADHALSILDQVDQEVEDLGRPADAADAPAWTIDWTVVTLANDGSWGVSTDRSFPRALALAIRDCRAMTIVPGDCGIRFTTTRGGWTVANLCGGHTIIETGDTLREAQQAASVRERDLRSSHALDMLPCWRVLTVDPRGAIWRAEAEAR
jgi:hypothetical protein